MRPIAAASALLLGLLFNHAASAVPISTTTVNFSPTAGSSFAFQWQDAAKCNPADATCFVTSINWTDPLGVKWTNVSEITSFSATFVADALTNWALSFRRVTPVVTLDSTFDIVNYASLSGSGTQFAQPAIENFQCTLVGQSCGGVGSPGAAMRPSTTWTYSTSTSVPEPGTVALLGLVLVVGVGMSRKRQA